MLWKANCKYGRLVWSRIAGDCCWPCGGSTQTQTAKDTSSRVSACRLDWSDSIGDDGPDIEPCHCGMSHKGYTPAQLFEPPLLATESAPATTTGCQPQVSVMNVEHA